MVNRVFKRAIGLVDWNTAIIASGASIKSKRADRAAQLALVHVENLLSDHLIDSKDHVTYRVRLRLYAGWHSGRTVTPYLQGITSVIDGYAARIRKYHGNRVLFQGGNEGIQLGYRLANVRTRLLPKHSVHFLDTLRYRQGVPEEKMTDTALVVDLLGLANRRSADNYVVISDDDDMLPGILASESVGANAEMLSRPNMSSKFMTNAKDLIHCYESVRS